MRQRGRTRRSRQKGKVEERSGEGKQGVWTEMRKARRRWRRKMGWGKERRTSERK